MGWSSIAVEAVGGGPWEPLDEFDRIASSSWNTWSHTDQKPRETAVFRIQSRICGVSFCLRSRRI